MKKETNFLKVNNFLFDLSPKTGSNSVMKVVLHGYGLKMGSDKIPNTYWHYHKHHSISDVLPDHIKIKIVRNPYNRAVSAFIHYMKATNQNISFVEWLKNVKNYTFSLKRLFSTGKDTPGQETFMISM